MKDKFNKELSFVLSTEKDFDEFKQCMFMVESRGNVSLNPDLRVRRIILNICLTSHIIIFLF